MHVLQKIGAGLLLLTVGACTGDPRTAGAPPGFASAMNGLARSMGGPGHLGSILQSLSGEERRQRQDTYYPQAPREPGGVRSGWSTGNNTGAPRSPPLRQVQQETYQGGERGFPIQSSERPYADQGGAAGSNGSGCKKVQKAVTLADGRQGTTEELECPISFGGVR